MRSRSRGGRSDRPPHRLSSERLHERSGANTTAITLVVLGVSTVAFGIGAGIVLAIEEDLVQETEQVAPATKSDADGEANSLATLMERLQAAQEPTGEVTHPHAATGTRSPSDREDAREEDPALRR